METILYIINESELGGATLSILDMLRIIRSNIRPIMVILDNGGFEKAVIKEKISYYVVPFTCGIKGMGKSCDKDKILVDNYIAALQICKIINKEHVNLIHTNTSTSNVGAIAAILSDIPHIWHVRELPVGQFDFDYADEELTIKLMKNSDRVIAISKSIQEVFDKKYGIKMMQIYNGLDLKKYKLTIDNREWNNKNILMPGAIISAKGQWEAIKAINILVKEGMKDIHLYIVGNGEPRFIWLITKLIRKYNLEQNITIMPFMDDLKCLREHCAYAITCSKWEALGRVTIEAMLAENIVIGANTGGTKELIGANEERGFLYQQGNCDDLADKIKKAMNSSIDEKEKKIKIAKAFALENFDNRNYAHFFEKEYHNVITEYKKDTKERIILMNELKNRYESNMHSYNNDNKHIGNQSLAIMQMWDDIAKKNHLIANFFSENKISEVVLYGFGRMGYKIYRSLLQEGIVIRGIMDQSPKFLDEVMDIMTIEEAKNRTTPILVTVIDKEKEIIQELKLICSCQVYGFSEIISWASK